MGAWVCASGSHVWSGNSGTFTANATAKARKIQRTADQSNGLALVESSVRCCDSAISTRSKSSAGSRSSSTRAWSRRLARLASSSGTAGGLGLLLGRRRAARWRPPRPRCPRPRRRWWRHGEAHDADEHQGGAEHREDEELQGGVDALAVAPPADEEVHRHEHDLEHHEEQEQVEGAEHADAPALQHEQPGVVRLRVVVRGDGDDRQREQQTRQHDEEQRHPVDAEVPGDPELGDPRRGSPRTGSRRRGSGSRRGATG